MKNRIRTQSLLARRKLSALAAVRQKRALQSRGFAASVMGLKLTPEVLARADALSAFTREAKRAAFLDRYRAEK